jgi:hypothetical protein
MEGLERARIAPLPDELHPLGYPTTNIPWGTERLARKSATLGSAEDPSPAAKAGAMYGPPHSRMNCAPWGTPRRTSLGARLRRATPSSGTHNLNDPGFSCFHRGW